MEFLNTRCNQETFTLCHECNVYLTSYAETIEDKKDRLVWFSFILFILKDTSLHQKYGDSI